MKPGDQFADKLETFLERNYARDQLKVSDFTDYFGMSRATLHARCTKLTGMSVIKYLNFFRTHKAVELLTSSSFQIKEIAFLVGYRDPNYFSRVFAREMGCSAMEWRTRADAQKH